MLYENLFSFFPSLYYHLKSFLKLRSPRLLNFRFFQPSCLLGTPVYLAVESTATSKICHHIIYRDLTLLSCVLTFTTSVSSHNALRLGILLAVCYL